MSADAPDHQSDDGFPNTSVRRNMSKGRPRLTALASVVTLVALAGGCTGSSAAKSPASPTPGTDVAAILHQAVEATLGSPGFTQQGYVGEGSDCSVAGDGVTRRGFYQAPDRYEEVDENAGTYIAVSNTTFVRDEGATTWLAEELAGETVRNDVATWLLPLLGRASVERVGSVYRADIFPVVLNKSFDYSANNAYYTFKGTIKTVIRDGKVQSVDIAGTLTNHGGVGLSVPSPVCGMLTYSAYGTSPSVSAPPASEVVQCPPGKTIAVSARSFVRCPSS